jgi:diguanylate cyclase (GGDEF)-like protein/PAS domain S-box-containing protein
MEPNQKNSFATLLRYCTLPLSIWALLVIGSLWTSLVTLQRTTVEVAETQGREVFSLVEAMRIWNAEHGGIFVLQSERDPPNPYLEPGMRSDVTASGQHLTRLNPAYMTRQLSGVIEREVGVRLHLTSLKPLNPDNAPTPWERQALEAFERGEATSIFAIENVDDVAYGRYIAPLPVKESCLACHAVQGYKLGDVRGGLAVEWPVQPLVEAMGQTREHSIITHGIVWLVVSLLMVFGIRQLLGNMAAIRRSSRALEEANRALEKTVALRTDELSRSLQTLRSIGDLSPGVLYQYRLRDDGTTCIPYASENFFDLFGLHPEEVREDALKVFARVHSDDVADLRTSTEASALALSRWHHEFRICMPDGSVRWVRGDTQPLREADGSILWNGFLIDITDAKARDAALAQSQEEYRLLFTHIMHGVVFQDAEGRIIGANPKAEELLGLSFDQMQGRTSIDPRWKAIHEDGSDFPGETHPAMQALRTGRAVCDVVMGVFNPAEEKTRWLLVSAVPQFRSNEAKPFEVFATFTDITEKRKAEQVLRQHKVVIDTAQDGFWMADAEGHILEVNQAYASMVGYSMEELSAMHISDLDAEESLADVGVRAERIIREGHALFETRHRHKDGHTIDMEVSVTFMRETQQFCVFCRNIARRKQMEAAMHDMAYFDTLTGLPNRRMLSDRLNQLMAASHRSGEHAALMFLDLDNFKPLNDGHGHEVGDLLLKEVAARLRSGVREIDTVARFGGDEFVVMLAELDDDQDVSTAHARRVADKLRRLLSAPYELTYNDRAGKAQRVAHHCSASVGVVVFRNHAFSEQELLKKADQVMYQAKQSGRDRVVIYGAG